MAKKKTKGNPELVVVRNPGIKFKQVDFKLGKHAPFKQYSYRPMSHFKLIGSFISAVPEDGRIYPPDVQAVYDYNASHLGSIDMLVIGKLNKNKISKAYKTLTRKGHEWYGIRLAIVKPERIHPHRKKKKYAKAVYTKKGKKKAVKKTGKRKGLPKKYLREAEGNMKLAWQLYREAHPKKTKSVKRSKKKNPELVIVRNAGKKFVKVGKHQIPYAAYKKFIEVHGKDAPLKVMSANLPKGMDGEYLVEMGDATRTDYKPPKGSKKAPHEYFHEHGEESGKNPSLASTSDGKHLLIVRKKGNKMRVGEWIHD